MNRREVFKQALSTGLEPFNEAYFKGFVDCIFEECDEQDFLKYQLPIARRIIGELDYETQLRQITYKNIIELITEQTNKDYEKRVVLAKLHNEHPKDLNDIEAMVMAYDSNEIIKEIKEELYE